MTSEIDKLKHFHVGYGLLCNIVVLKVIKNEEK